jgi:hypothetical protein
MVGNEFRWINNTKENRNYSENNMEQKKMMILFLLTENPFSMG